VQPGTTDAAAFFTTTTGRGESGDYTGVVFSTLGNRNLKPERSTELEVGIDGTFWNGRLSTEVTYYNKSSKDALVSRVLPPSLGTGPRRALENLGNVTNKGVEALVNARLIETRQFGWDITLNGSSNANKLVTLGGVPNIVSSSTLQQREGYPLNGWWSRGLLGFDDKDGNGIITNTGCAALQKDNTAACEILVSDTTIFLGRSQPKYELTFSSGFDLLNHRLRLTGLFDYKGGFKNYNNTGASAARAASTAPGSSARTRRSSSRRARSWFASTRAARSVASSRTATSSGPRAVARVHGAGVVRGALRPGPEPRRVGLGPQRRPAVDEVHRRGPRGVRHDRDAPSEFQAFAPPTYFSFRLNLGF
jgi:hypothetical protein